MENRLHICQFCGEDFNSILELNRHLVHIHVNEPNFEIECATCHDRFHKYSSLRSHMSRLHPLRGNFQIANDLNQELMDIDIVQQQNFENVPNAEEGVDDLENFQDVEHINLDQQNNVENVHNAEERADNLGNFQDVEDMNVDQQNNVGNILNVDVNNLENFQDVENAGIDNEYESDEYSDEDSDDNEDSEEEEDIQNENDNAIEDNNDEKKKSIGKFLLQLRAISPLSESDFSSILLNVKNVVQVHARELLLEADTIIAAETGNHLTNFINIEEKVNSLDCIYDLNHRRKREKYFEREFNVVKPIRYTLGTRFIKRGSANCGESRINKNTPEQMMYVPITSVIKKWAGHESFASLLYDHVPQENIYASHEDGSYFLNHEYFKDKPDALRIFLYYDEVEMCDGLGSKASDKQKIGMFYFAIGNMHAKYRSELKFINLAASVKYSYIKRYGMNKVLEPLIQEFKLLENGIDGPNGKIYGTLFAFQGDNLAVHMVCGLKEGFTANHPCRDCMATLQEVREMTQEDSSLLRSPEQYDRQVAEIEEAEGQERERLKTNYGINRRCALNQLTGFHATRSVPHDIVHDFLLGILPLHLQLFMQKVILKNLDLEILNGRIRDYDYGFSELPSKPSTIKPQHLIPGNNIHQNASQMFLLSFIIPFIIQDAVEEDCPYLEHYNQLLEIISILFGRSLSTGILEYVESITEDYLESFRDLFKEDLPNVNPTKRNLIPKHHYVLHNSRNVRNFGPIYGFWCMRMEAKHQFFKRIVQAMRNFKNLPFTLSQRHQLYQAWIFQLPLLKSLTHGPAKLVSIDKLNFGHMFPNDLALEIVPWIKYEGIKYVSNKCYIPVAYSSENLPIFAELISIVLTDHLPIFVCRKVSTVCHNLKLMAYEIKRSENFICYTPENVIAHYVYHSHRFKEVDFISVKQCIGDLH